MSALAERTERVKDLVAQVKEHCMCAKFEDLGHTYRIIYPVGYFPEGVQASTGAGKAIALERVLDVMERHWQASFI